MIDPGLRGKALTADHHTRRFMSSSQLPIQAVIDEVWSSIVGTALEVTDSEEALRGPTMAATVPYYGDWRGAVIVRVDAPLARIVGSRMFMIPEDELTDADVQDAVGEVCNMIGGNLRAHLSRTCELGTPTIATGTGLHVCVPDTHALARIRYRSEDCGVEVTLLQQQAA